MDAVTVTRRIDSAHLDLPELLLFVGKEVEIRVRELVPPPAGTPDRWKPLWEAAGRGLIDEDAIREMREFDIAEAQRELESWQETHNERGTDAPR